MARHRRNRQGHAAALSARPLQIDGSNRSLRSDDELPRRPDRSLMASKDSRKNTRISVACTACRARKHRCGGERPQCSQCVTNNLTCEWPTQLKRGPPKHYVYSVETRLLETEAILISVLSQVSPEQLQAALQQVPLPNQAQDLAQNLGDQDVDRFAGIRNDVCKPSYWNSFPIDSEDNVRRWWKDRRSRANIAPFPLSPGHVLPEAALTTEQNAESFQVPELSDEIDARPFSFLSPAGQLPQTTFTSDDVRTSLFEGDSASVYAVSPPAHEENNRSLDIDDNGGAEAEKASKSHEVRDSILKLPDHFKRDFVW